LCAHEQGTQHSADGFSWGGSAPPGLSGAANLLSGSCDVGQRQKSRQSGFPRPVVWGGGRYGGSFSNGDPVKSAPKSSIFSVSLWPGFLPTGEMDGDTTGFSVTPHCVCWGLVASANPRIVHHHSSISRRQQRGSNRKTFPAGSKSGPRTHGGAVGSNYLIKSGKSPAVPAGLPPAVLNINPRSR